MAAWNWAPYITKHGSVHERETLQRSRVDHEKAERDEGYEARVTLFP
jgi:hypothetical protein